MPWQTKKLNEVCNLIKGKKPSRFVLKSNKPYLTARVVRNTEKPKFAAENCSTSIWVKKEDIVIIMDGSNSGEMFTGLSGALASTMGIINYQKGLLNPKYLLHFLITHRENFTKSRTGAAIPHLNKEEFENLDIPLPPLHEQRRIVKILDEVFEKMAKVKENAEKNLKNAEELFESYLQSIFSNKKWEEGNLSDVCDVEYGYTEKARSEGDYRFVRITDTDENGLLAQEKKMYINYFKEANKYILKDGDLLMARTGASAGNVLLFGGDEKAVFASYLIRMRFKKEIFSKLYWYFSKSKFYWDQVGQLSAGSAQPQFNGGALKQIIFYYPKSLSEQKSIVKKLDTLSAETKKLEAIYKKKLADLEELKKSVLKKALSGEL